MSSPNGNERTELSELQKLTQLSDSKTQTHVRLQDEKKCWSLRILLLTPHSLPHYWFRHLPCIDDTMATDHWVLMACWVFTWSDMTTYTPWDPLYQWLSHFSRHQDSPRGFVKHHLSFWFSRTSEFAFLASSQAILMLLVQGPLIYNIIPILQVRKMRFWEVKWQAHSYRKGAGPAVWSAEPICLEQGVFQDIRLSGLKSGQSQANRRAGHPNFNPNLNDSMVMSRQHCRGYKGPLGPSVLLLWLLIATVYWKLCIARNHFKCFLHPSSLQILITTLRSRNYYSTFQW